MKNELPLFRATQVINYVLYVLEALLVFRFFLKLLGANPGAGFTNLIYNVTAWPLAPFKFVFGTNSIQGSIFEWSTLLAMLVYWVIAMGLIKLLLVGRPVSSNEARQELNFQDDNL